MSEKILLILWAVILGCQVAASGDEPGTGSPPFAAAEERRVEDIHYTMKAGESLVIPREDILKAFKGAQGSADVSRLMMEPGRHGAVTIDAGQFSFVPEEGFVGTALLQFAVKDEKGSMTAKVFIDVVAQE